MAQPIQIVLRHGIFIHARIHGRRDHFRAAARQHRRGKHIVRQTIGELCNDIGGGRRDQDQIRLLCQRNVFDVVLKVAVKGIYHAFLPGNPFKSNRGNEFCPVFTQKYVYIGPLLGKLARKRGRLISGNTSGHSQQDGLLF